MRHNISDLIRYISKILQPDWSPERASLILLLIIIITPLVILLLTCLFKLCIGHGYISHMLDPDAKYEVVLSFLTIYDIVWNGCDGKPA